jgi:hypothetical protein
VLDRLSDDYSYVLDLGLIREDREKVELANPIYAEVIIRAMNRDIQDELVENEPRYHLSRYLQNGAVDMEALLCSFQVFWRENAEIWREKYDYKEAAPHLVLHAFLQRLLNGGGQISREFSAGFGRVDLCVSYQNRKYPIELKIRRGPHTYTEGIKQTLSYMDTLGCKTGWLVIFDPREGLSWDERIFIKQEHVNGRTVTVLGC